MKNNNECLLVVEDNPGIQKQLKWSFDGYEVHLADDRESALELVRKHKPQVVTLDLGLPPDRENATQGILALEQILDELPECKVIVVTGNEDRENALTAIKLGAYDFYQKPIDPDILRLIVDRAFNLHAIEAENRKLGRQKLDSPISRILGSSQAMQTALRMTEKVAASDATALVQGESGTGKELIARALHELSQRSDEPFVAINCAAIPHELLESELFGYEKGAFTGAHKTTPGKIEHANGGTLFLDEIGDMPMSLQAKLLRFLQERVVERIGGRQSIPVDIRIVCATHRDLEKAIRDGDFREDLYFRISEIVINVPPLRDREEDIVLLAQYFLDQFSAEMKKRFKGFSSAAKRKLDEYQWPGNVRELENKIKRAVILTEGNRVEPEDLGFSAGAGSGDMPMQSSLSLKAAREAVERKVIKQALTVYENNYSKAAEALEISRPSLYSLLKKLGMDEA